MRLPCLPAQALSSGLLSAGDLRSDLLVGQAVRAFWAAAAADSSSATAAACLLSRLRPSLKVLTSFKTYIEVCTLVGHRLAMISLPFLGSVIVFNSH